MLSVYAGMYFFGRNPNSYSIQSSNFMIRQIEDLGGIHLKKISKTYNIYNWKAVQKIHNTSGFNVIVGLRNPDDPFEAKSIPFEDFDYQSVKKNIYNGWHVSGIYVYSDDNGFVGSIEDVLKIYNKNIVPFRSSQDNPYCQIGFCEKDKKWYAWHRFNFQKMKSFSIGTSTQHGQDIFVPSGYLDLVRHFQALSLSFERVIAWIDDNPKRIVLRTYKDKDQDSKEYEQKQFLYPREWGHGSWTATSLDDAKTMAIEFVEYLPYVFQGGN